jgi:hypothetical protein
MKSVIQACLFGSILVFGADALYSQRPAKQGISVEMPVCRTCGGDAGCR